MSWIKEEGKLNENTYLIDSLLFAQKESMACYLIVGTKKKVLIDASGKMEGKTVVKKLNKLSITPDILILTHSHWDHSGGANKIKKAFPALEIMASHHGIESLKNQQEFNKWFSDYSPKLKPIEDVILVKNNDAIDIGGIELRIIETPGHTNCSLSILDPKNKMLFIGDSLGYPLVENVFLAPLMPPEFSEDKLMSTIKKIDNEIEYESICPAHYGCFTGDTARAFPENTKKAYYFWKNFLLSKWKENPEKEHIIEEMRKKFEKDGIGEREAEAYANMFGDWYVKALKVAKMI
ncbi:MAG: MBL fold metallo-hydrolase [Candidatus Helarchaeota archaeon]